jgi:hypothetical protein
MELSGINPYLGVHNARVLSPAIGVRRGGGKMFVFDKMIVVSRVIAMRTLLTSPNWFKKQKVLTS